MTINLKGFTGINNVDAIDELGPAEFLSASNCYVDDKRRLLRRPGRTLALSGHVHSVFDAGDYHLAVRNYALVAMAQDLSVTTIHPSIGPLRVWYAKLPDGRVLYSNGLLNGTTDGATRRDFGVPTPASGGDVQGVGPGEARPITYALTYRRDADGLEGGAFQGSVEVPEGQLSWVGLPQLAGHSIVVYAIPQGYQTMQRLGVTATDSFTFTPALPSPGFPLSPVDSAADGTTLRLTWDWQPAPVGTIACVWAGRVLIAVGSVLFATRPFMIEACDLARDYKMFTGTITGLIPTDNGVWVGTDKALHFLAGQKFDQLRMNTLGGPVRLGSMLEVDEAGPLVPPGARNGIMVAGGGLAIVDDAIAACLPDGALVRLTDDTYRAPASDQVYAALRTVNGTLQYTAATG